MTSEAQKKASKRYIQKLDKISLRMPAGTKKIIQTKAKAENKSVNQFIIDKITEN